MAFQCEIDPVGRRIGLVDADGDAGKTLQRRYQRRRQPAIVIVDDADVPGPVLPL